jgi:TIR domain
MTTRNHVTVSEVARLLRQCLDQGCSVEIDGLGVFHPDSNGGFRLAPPSRPSIFLAYVSEDLAEADRLSRDFRALGFDPWLDKSKLIPGQNWARSIENAIEMCDFFVPLFSRRSVNKRGIFQSELRYALDCARRLPLDQTFFIPVRLDDCTVPPSIARAIQCVDLFPDWDRGVKRIAAAVRRQIRAKAS